MKLLRVFSILRLHLSWGIYNVGVHSKQATAPTPWVGSPLTVVVSQTSKQPSFGAPDPPSPFETVMLSYLHALP